jgi:GTP-binding protein
MVDGVLLLVDAFDGPMPQTREVLKKALALDLQPVVVINKIDRPGADPLKVVDKVLELFMDLNATDEQLEFPVVYASAKNGIAKMNLNDDTDNITCIFDTIIDKISGPEVDPEGPTQLLVSNIQYDDYLGRLAIGRVERGSVKQGDNVVICRENGNISSKVTKLFTYEGLNKVEVESVEAGDICCIAGLAEINIGDTIADPAHPDKIPFVNIDEPTVSMTFSVNDGPFAGKEGKFVTSRHIRDRLMKELERNVSLRVKDTDKADSFEVSGRGELHLSVLIETMRREGFELLVSRPKVIFKEIDGVKCEPYETLAVNVPEDTAGTVIQKIGMRKGEMVNMEPGEPGHTKIEFVVPARGLIGYRTEFLTDTRGSGVMSSVFKEYGPYKGDIQSRTRGTIIAFEQGTSITYGLYNAQLRGELLIGAGVEVYEGMVVGINSRLEDISVNVCKEKHLTNTRASGSDEALRLVPPVQMSLEQAIEFIADDELVEVTPENIRIRKKILDTKTREREFKRAQAHKDE